MNWNHRSLLLALFALSGFAGLIYESIWTHYLKLFLGHAAYAQTLVLAIFMGGMALGAWLCARYSVRWKNLLLSYALVEGVIGAAALVFHPLFDGYVQFAYTTLLPAAGQPEVVTLLKWVSATLLILPQSILLGMTFPLMSGALIRRYPENPGATVAMLYFTNSIGASVGVLVSGFVLIEAVGLPGTIRVAGALNLLLAALIWRLARHGEPAFHIKTAAQIDPTSKRRLLFFLGIAAFTGAASFIYEIAWLRMLSLVLGSSTHAFELMLSAFILGLALGGLWIKRRIDSITHPLRFLAVVQILMGVMAASTLLLYNQTFEVMAWLITTLSKDDTGYAWFNIASHGIAAAIMVPTTFLAGMTLPLITYTLIQQGHGEKSIGSVYASNTLGAILGIFFATHLGMPLLGLKGLLLTGATLDVALGIILIWWFREQLAVHWATLATALGAGALAFTLATGPMNLLLMSSGVYRSGKLRSADYTILFHQDGKTASIDLVQSANTATERLVSITTNGKPEAMLNMAKHGTPAPDESTMILASALPIVLHPNASSAAVIGMGSGLSTHTLLAAGLLDVVDTIEIEPAMINASHGFRPRVELAYSSPQSYFHIDDAKSYFSTHNKKYDIILSEPSNPWVSGVSSLFSEEFYKLIKRHLTPQGVLVQWMQTYEMEEELVASVIKALSLQFKDFVIYAPNDVDIIIVARADALLTAPAIDLLTHPQLSAELASIGIKNTQDLELRRIGNRHSLAPLYASYAIPANSDYNPVLDLRATRARFLDASADKLIEFRNSGIPALEMLSSASLSTPTRNVTSYYMYKRTHFVNLAVALHNYLARDSIKELLTMEGFMPGITQQAKFVKAAFIECRVTAPPDTWLHTTSAIFNLMIPQLAAEQMLEIWQRIQTAPCADGLTTMQRKWLDVWTAVSRRDIKAMEQQAVALLPISVTTEGLVHSEYLLLCAMLGQLMQNNPDAARNIWIQYAPSLYQTRKSALVARLIAAHAFVGKPIPYLR